MTPRRKNALGILLSIALAAAVLSCRSCAGGEVGRIRKTNRITTLRPIRAKGRADAGYPFLQTTANCTRVIANVSGLLNPLGWILR